ncbi:restriction endonuclease subunit S [Buttiauxella gaviniae]|uniref:restriction endonuclease subunit S n=1 Tax=Buttiauxella gaviniae TaxID=82990 RepID=UPI003BB5AC1A
MSNSVSFLRYRDVADFRNGLNFSKNSHGKGCLIISVADFKDYLTPQWTSLGEINPINVAKEDDYLKKDDIIFVRSNGNKKLVGRSLYIDRDVKSLFSGFCIRARLKTDDFYPLFLAYFSKTERFSSSINSFAGTNINNLNQDILGDVKIPLYSKGIQKSIVDVLSSIDKKITLNNNINSELEAMAKTLYDYWFVQFDFPDTNGKPYKNSGGKMVYNSIFKKIIPIGWVPGTLDDLGQIVGGSTPSKSNPENFTLDGTSWITPNDLSNNQGYKFISRGTQDVSEAGIKAASLKKYPAGTVLLSSRAPIGYMAIAIKEVTTNQGFKSFIPTKGCSTEYIYYSVKRCIPIIEQHASGSTFKEISGSALKEINIIIPEKNVMDKFTKTVTNIFTRQEKLELENKQLIKLRDWLLPMLMNGQVTVR